MQCPRGYCLLSCRPQQLPIKGLLGIRSFPETLFEITIQTNRKRKYSFFMIPGWPLHIPTIFRLLFTLCILLVQEYVPGTRSPHSLGDSSISYDQITIRVIRATQPMIRCHCLHLRWPLNCNKTHCDAYKSVTASAATKTTGLDEIIIIIIWVFFKYTREKIMIYWL